MPLPFSLHSAPPPAGAPDVARGAMPPWFERLAGPSVDASRHLLLALVFALAFLLSLAGLVIIASRQQIQPYVLQAGRDGAILPAGQRLVPYRPGQAEQRYFLAQWVRHLLSIDSRLSENWLAEAYQQTRGKAIREFTDWVAHAGPLQKLKLDPTLSRAVSVASISLLDGGVALVRVRCEQRSLGQPAAQPEHYLLTLHFTAEAPDSEEAILRNPIGLLVNDFQITEDLAP